MSRLGIGVVVDSKVRAGFKKVEAQTKAFKENMRGLLTGGVLAGAGRAAAGGGFFSLAAGISAASTRLGPLGAAIGLTGTAMTGLAGKSHGVFADFQKGWAEVTTLMPQLTRQATDEMSTDLRSFATSQGVNLSDATKAAYQAVSAGVDPGNLQPFLEGAWTAAVGGISDLTTAVDVISTVLNAYNLEADQTQRVNDTMFTAIRLGKTTFSEMAPELGAVLPLAGSMNVEFEQVTASVAALTAQGASTSEAITRVRAAMVALSKETGAKKMFEDLTGMTFPEFIAAGGNIQQALEMIVDEAERTGESLPGLFGRIEGSIAALSLSAPRGAEIFADSMQVTAGATEAAANKIEETDARTIDRIKARWNEFKVKFGELVSKTLRGIVDLWQKHGDTLIAELQPIIDAIVGLFRFLWNTIKHTFLTFKAAFTKDYDEGWLGYLQMAVGLFVDTFMYLWRTTWDTIKGIFNVFAGIFTLDFKRIWEGLGSIAKAPLEALANFMKDIWDRIAGGIAAVVNWIGSTFVNMWGKIIDVWKQGVSFIADQINFLIEGFNRFAGIIGVELPTINTDPITEAMDKLKLSWEDVSWSVKRATDSLGDWDDSVSHSVIGTAKAGDAIEVVLRRIARDPDTGGPPSDRDKESPESSTPRDLREAIARRLALFHEFGRISSDEYIERLSRMLERAGGELTNEGQNYARTIRNVTDELERERLRAFKNANQAAKETEQARLAALQRQRDLLDRMYALGEITVDEYIRILEERIQEVGGKYTDLGFRYQQTLDQIIENQDRARDDALEKQRDEQRALEDRMYQMGEIGTDKYIAILEERIAAAGGRFTEEGFRFQQAIDRIIDQQERESDRALAAEERERNRMLMERYEREDRQYALGQITPESYANILRKRIVEAGGPLTDIGFRAQQLLTKLLEDVLYVGIKIDDKPPVIKKAERQIPRRVVGCA